MKSHINLKWDALLALLTLVAFAFLCDIAFAHDADNNPPGPVGGRGTNWENPAGPVGGPGASPDYRVTAKTSHVETWLKNHPKVLTKFDADGDGFLNKEERQAAREARKDFIESKKASNPCTESPTT